MPKQNQIILHALVAKPSSLAIDLEITRRLGFDGLEASGAKIKAFLDAGWTRSELSAAIGDMFIPGIGFLVDVERQGDDFAALLAEARTLFELAQAVGAKGVQVITGPLSLAALQPRATMPAGLYRGLIDLPIREQVRKTAANLAILADMAKDYGLLLYLEALSWTPLNTLDLQVEVIQAANRDNIRLVVDFWHCYTSGDTPERVARFDKNLIFGVHICDSHRFDGGVPDEAILRDVPTGSGVLNLSEWVDAVKATGYDGWWSCELFCRKQHQDNSFAVAAALKDLMVDLVTGRTNAA